MIQLLQRPRVLAIFVSFAVAHFLSVFLRSTNAAIAPDLSRDLSLTAAELGLMTSLYYVCFALVQLPLGVALDRFGARRVTSSMMLITVGGCLLFASASSLASAALGRALIGVGMATVLMGAMQIFSQWFPSNRVATVSGFMTGLSSLGGMLASTPLSWMNETLGWRVIFLSMAPLVLLSAVTLVVIVRERKPETPPTQPVAARTQVGFSQIFRDSRFWRIGMTCFFLFGTMQAVQSLWAGPYLFDVLRLGSIEVGNVLLALNIGLVIGYFNSGWLSDRYGVLPVVIIVGVFFLFCLLSLALLGLWMPVSLIMLVLAIFGFCGSFNMVLLSQVRTMFPPEMTGRALTAVNMLAFVGTALLQWAMGVIIGLFEPSADGHYPVSAYTTVFLLIAVAFGLALSWYMTLRREKPVSQSVVAS